MPARQQFVSHLKKAWIPALEGAGFAGRPWEFKRTRGRYIHCVALQRSSDRDRFCVNLGVHLDFLSGGSEVREVECEIRDRLRLEGEDDHWWSSSDGAAEGDGLVETFNREGIRFFERFSDFPKPFTAVRVEDFATPERLLASFPELTTVRLTRLLALVHEEIGDFERALEFAELGLRLDSRARIGLRDMAKRYRRALG